MGGGGDKSHDVSLLDVSGLGQILQILLQFLVVPSALQLLLPCVDLTYTCYSLYLHNASDIHKLKQDKMASRVLAGKLGIVTGASRGMCLSDHHINIHIHT